MSLLIADIGGTNTRCALAGPDGPEQRQHFSNQDFPSAAALLDHYLGSLAVADRPKAAALAVAAPVRNDTVQMTNLHWSINAGELRTALGLQTLKLLNDFEALACALPALSDTQVHQIGGGQPDPRGTKVVIGPGTGLGMSTLVRNADGWRALAGEGGHASLAASNAQETAIISKVRERYGHCSIERLVSGPGLSLIHELLHGEESLLPEQIGELITSGNTAACASFDLFCELLGTAAADAALMLGAFGGVYIGGGIAPHHDERFCASGFRRRFTAKGRYADYLNAIPTYLIKAPDPTLIGLCTLAAD
ncbi:MAG: glucokinase [Gammaproteobacteria bacterium]